MSDSADNRTEPTDRQAMARLEAMVGRLLEERARLEGRAHQAEVRVRELEALLRGFTDGTSDPAVLQTHVSRLETENEALRERLETGRAGVERLLARIRFFEEQG